MRLKTTILAAAALWLTVSALSVGPGASPGGAAALQGREIPDFSLPDFTGKQHSLEQYRNRKGVVLIFVSTRCPVSNDYNERMVALAEEYQSKGFQFLGINANKTEGTEEMSEHAARHGWNFPVLKDEGNVLADKLGASVTPEVYVIDPRGVLRYHGRIDDSRDPSSVGSQDLREALDALLAGREVDRKEAKAFGCSIKRVS